MNETEFGVVRCVVTFDIAVRRATQTQADGTKLDGAIPGNIAAAIEKTAKKQGVTIGSIQFKAERIA